MNKGNYLFQPLEKLSSIMQNIKEEIEYILEKKLEFKIRPILILDRVIVEFLKKYMVFIQPITLNKKNLGQALLGEALTRMFGIDYDREIFIVSSQEKQTKIKGWAQWKQWAMDNKEFESFRFENIDSVKQYNKSIDELRIQEKLKDPPIKKEFNPIFEELRREEEKSKKEKEEYDKILKINGMPFKMIISLVVEYFVATYQEDDSSSYKPITLFSYITTFRADLSEGFDRFYEFFYFN